MQIGSRLYEGDFLAHVAAVDRRKCLLRAIVEAHVSIELTGIYEILKELRRSGGYPAPSVASVNRGLQDLLKYACPSCDCRI